MREISFHIHYDSYNKVTLISRSCNVERPICERCKWKNDCDRLMKLIENNIDKAGPAFRCNYCWRILPEDEADFKEVAIRAGKDEWQYKGRVCRECRDYLKGLWKEIRNNDEEIKINPEWMDTMEKGARIGKPDTVD